MRYLMITAGFGVAEARLADDARRNGSTMDVIDVQGPSWLRFTGSGRPVPLFRWIAQWPLRDSSNQVARVMRQVLERGAYDLILASGLRACGFAGRYLEAEFVPLLWRGDLDFSAARRHAEEDFAAVTRAVDRLFLEDEWEFDKAQIGRAHV